MRLLRLLAFCPLVWAQEPKTDAEQLEKLSKEIADYRAETARTLKLMNWYQQQFFACQAQAIEQQVAPRTPKPEPAKEPAK